MSYIRVLHLFVKVMLDGRYTIISRHIGIVISVIVLGCYNSPTCCHDGTWKWTSTGRLDHVFLLNHFIYIMWNMVLRWR